MYAINFLWSLSHITFSCRFLPKISWEYTLHIFKMNIILVRSSQHKKDVISEWKGKVEGGGGPRNKRTLSLHLIKWSLSSYSFIAVQSAAHCTLDNYLKKYFPFSSCFYCVDNCPISLKVCLSTLKKKSICLSYTTGASQTGRRPKNQRLRNLKSKKLYI